MGLNIKHILAVLFILVILSNFSFSTAYEIETDLDVNKFEADDYLDLTQSAIGEGLRTTSKNVDWIPAVLVIGFFALLILSVITVVIKRKN